MSAATTPPATDAARSEADALRVITETNKRVLDPVDRISEIIFGLVMVLTFTGTLRVAESGRDDVREMLVAALGCNIAWGIVDGVMYVVASMVRRTRIAAVYRGIRAAGPDRARAIVLAALPEGVAAITDEADADRMVARARALPDVPVHTRISSSDLLGALACFLLTVVATFPPTIPFLVVHDVRRALWISNAVAVASLFFAGSALAKATGIRRSYLGLVMVAIGVALVAVTILLGG